MNYSEYKKTILSSNRLYLRAFNKNDDEVVCTLAGAHEVADTTLRIPHPYKIEMAEAWIDSHKELILKNIEYPFAICLKEKDLFIGVVALLPNMEFNNAELGYWIGKPYRNRGYATEAAAEILRYGFMDLNYHRIYAHYFSRNHASGRVLQKIGMKYEGKMHQHILKNYKYEDLDFYGLLKSDYKS